MKPHFMHGVIEEMTEFLNESCDLRRGRIYGIRSWLQESEDTTQQKEEPEMDTPEIERDSNYYSKRTRPEMREFKGGAIRNTDTGKLDYEGFLSPFVLKAYCEYLDKHRTCADGTIRESDNWQGGIPSEVCMKSLLRHTLDAWIIHRRGTVIEDGEVVSKKDALCASMFNIMVQLHDMEKPQPEREPEPVVKEKDKQRLGKAARFQTGIPDRPGLCCKADSGHDCVGINCGICLYALPIPDPVIELYPSTHRREITNLKSWPGSDPCNCWEHCVKLSKCEPCDGCGYLFNNERNYYPTPPEPAVTEAAALAGPPCTGSEVGRPCLDCDEDCTDHPDHKEDAS